MGIKRPKRMCEAAAVAMFSRQRSVSCSVCALHSPNMHVNRAKSIESHPSFRRHHHLLSLSDPVYAPIQNQKH